MKKVQKPTLVIDEHICRSNIRKMQDIADRNEMRLRPHFKTHQSLDIGRWFTNEGISSITVSSVDMARYFLPEWNDITIAFPFNIREIDEVNSFPKTVTLNLITSDPNVVNFLADHLENQTGLFIEVDVGSGRSGLLPSDFDLINNIIAEIEKSTKLELKGFITHAGQSYKCRGKQTILDLHKTIKEQLQIVKQNYINDFPNLQISIGDTPICSVATDFTDIDEIRPGNFVFYDLMQWQIGSCKLADIAVTMHCPVVEIRSHRNEIIIYGGAVHFSKDSIILENEGEIFGYGIETEEDGRSILMEGVYVKRLSQEHGVVKVAEPYIDKFRVGDLIKILPVHSCLTMNLMKDFSMQIH